MHARQSICITSFHILYSMHGSEIVLKEICIALSERFQNSAYDRGHREHRRVREHSDQEMHLKRCRVIPEISDPSLPSV